MKWLVLLVAITLTEANNLPYDTMTTPDTAIIYALGHNPEVKMGEELVKRAEGQLAEARKFLFHSLAIHFNTPLLQTVPTAPDGTTAYMAKPTEVMFVVSLDLGDLLTWNNRMKKEKASLAHAKYSLEKTKSEVERDIAIRFSQLKFYEKELSNALEVLKSAEMHHTITKQRFLTREVTFAEYHTALGILMKSKSTVAEKEQHLEITLAHLKKLVPLPEKG